MDAESRQNKFRGVLIGTAVGDALGLPAEGLSRKRATKFFHNIWKHRFIGSHGMVSDDTDHSLFVAQSLLAHPEDAEAFARRLGWCLRLWLLAVPAGIGLATLKATLRLWCGVPCSRSGVYSAGNGAAMRVAPVGAFFAEDAVRRESFVRAATLLTHTDPKAQIGASAIASITAWCLRETRNTPPDLEEFAALLRNRNADDVQWQTLVQAIAEAAAQQKSVAEFAQTLGLSHGVTGYVYHTVPVAVYAWYRHFGDFRATLTAVLDCGGDTDTTGAIAGALAGATVGESGIPADWINGLWEWPRTVRVLRAVADNLTVASEGNRAITPVVYFWPGVPVRNLLFLIFVLLHGFRRLAPPY